MTSERWSRAGRPRAPPHDAAALPVGAARARPRAHAGDLGAGSGGLSRLLFLLPLLVVFGAFSWYPIVRLVVMSLQHTNLVQPPTWVGLAELQRGAPRPAVPDRAQEHGRVRRSRAASSAIRSR